MIVLINTLLKKYLKKFKLMFYVYIIIINALTLIFERNNIGITLLVLITLNLLSVVVFEKEKIKEIIEETELPEIEVTEKQED